jgi:hypothetical protein
MRGNRRINAPHNIVNTKDQVTEPYYRNSLGTTRQGVRIDAEKRLGK